MKNYYHILGLSFEANPEPQVLEAAYKALVKLYHPDVFKGERKVLRRQISEINEAHEILFDPKQKDNYDKKLQQFLAKNNPQFYNEEFKDNDFFDKDYANEDWEIALIVYPELENAKKKLENYSYKLGLQFQFYLLETKEFDKIDLIIEFFISAFLERKFGKSKDIRSLSRHLIENNFKKPALYLNKLVKVIGYSSEKRILRAFFMEHEHLRERFDEQLKTKKKSKKNLSFEFSDLESIPDYIPLTIFTFFIILMFLLIIFPEIFR